MFGSYQSISRGRCKPCGTRFSSLKRLDLFSKACHLIFKYQQETTITPNHTNLKETKSKKPNNLARASLPPKVMRLGGKGSDMKFLLKHLNLFFKGQYFHVVEAVTEISCEAEYKRLV